MNLRSLFQLVQVFQSRKNDLLACLLNLACEKDFVQDGVDLYEGRGISYTFHINLPPMLEVSDTHLVEIED